MDGIIHPNVEQVCRKYIYKDGASAEIATLVHENPISTEDLDTRVLTYLMENSPYARHWDTIAARLRVGDIYTQKAFNTLDAPAQQCLRLRALNGCSIPEIASTCRLTPQKVHAVLRAARYNFWKAFVISEARVLHKCRQFVYSDTDAMEAAIASCSHSCSISKTDVLAYLDTTPVSWENWDTLAIDFKALDAGTAARDVQEIFETLEASEKALLRLRVVDGHTIATIARTRDETKAHVEASLITYRTKFWRTLVETDCVVLRECRRLIHDDRDAEEIAVAIQKRGVPVENVRRHIYDYLVERWDTTPDWDDPAFIKVVEAVVDPTVPKSAGFEAAKTAYNLLEYPEQDLLKFKGVEGVSDEIIAQVSMEPLNQVKEKAGAAKETFWKLFTRERWSTLAYFIEKLCEDADSSSTDILKVEAEYLAAKAAYNSLDEIDKEVLRQRCVQGLSVEEIAAKQRVFPIEVAETLTEARKKFYQEFLAEIYRLWGLKTPIEIGGDEDDISNAWETLQEQLYKFVPENFRGWLTTAAQHSKLDSKKKDYHRRLIPKDHGLTYMNPEGELVPVISVRPLQADEVLEREESEKKELKFWENERERWHELLTRTTEAILGSKKPEKKLYLLMNYILQPKLNELRGAETRVPHEFQKPGEAMAVSHVDHQYQSEVTQTWIGEPIDATDRSIRRYVGEIISLVEASAEEVGIEGTELVAGCAPIKESDVKKRRD